MSAGERNFATYELGDNVYELAEELIPEIADGLGVDLGPEPNSEALGELVGKIGKNKVLRDNDEVTAFDREQMADFVDRSGVQLALNRSLWTPDTFLSGDSEDESNTYPVILSGGVANWQDRSAAVLGSAPGWNLDGPVYLVSGNRIMNGPTEVTHTDVQHIHQTFKRYPTEAEYAASVIRPYLTSPEGACTDDVLPIAYETGNGDEIARRFFEDNEHLLEEKLVFVRVANAGIQLAAQFRKAAREVDEHFDADRSDPQVFVVTDTLPVARLDWQENLPAKYQKAATALRQVALTAKLLHEAAV
ncbi:MAG TPA: hypothetical protein VG604_02585 [Candidatus Saccharimonadales bacterium]|nr:hypothetical protein [Candidatus Saccharimonadales bacterium]